MKNLFLLLFAVCFITACQKEKQRYFFDSAEIETLKSGIKAYEAQDWDQWKSNFADTAKVYVNSKKGISTDERIEGFNSMLAYFSSYGFEEKGSFSEMVIDKDEETWVNYWGNWKGTLKANNKEISIPVHLTVQFIDGKIVEEYAYYDTFGVNTAISEIEAAKMAEEEEEMVSEEQ